MGKKDVKGHVGDARDHWFIVIKKPATKARQCTNPFTCEPMMFKPEPARKIVRARPVKVAKDAV